MYTNPFIGPWAAYPDLATNVPLSAGGGLLSMTDREAIALVFRGGLFPTPEYDPTIDGTIAKITA